jgi:hypothetical protein
MHLRAVSGLHPRPRRLRRAVVPGVPTVATGMSDRAGRTLALGSAVLVRGGEHAGRIGEVVGCGGRRGVELILHGPRPAFLALPPASVELVDATLLDPIMPRRWPPGVSAAAGGPWQASDRPTAEPQPDGAIPGDTRSSPAAGEHHELSRPRSSAWPKAGRQPGSPQRAEVAP